MNDDRVLALAGLVQALRQVRRIAETGQADAGVLSTSLDSVFRIDAASPEEVYGGAANVRSGLLLLRDYLGNQGDDPQLPKLALSVTQLERRFVANDAVAERVHEGILAIKVRADQLGSSHPDVLSELGSLYAETVSHLRPKVMVQGNPHYLGQAGVVAEIRAVLLAALRSAVLWRQLGGSVWDLFLRKRALQQSIEGWLD
ncbi:high frequency lysogenization protein HflD [Luteimonas saliphila]|uniref:high frequency lysogenization protein HflD n=1 Tax=Luteimonas saliphila TaxID=2804919 RepID=UPI00192DDAF8|nr:high frequency lysogenization protein HflD [Luteimonas saliphila]